MKHCIFFALMFFSLHLGAQCVVPITEGGVTTYISIDEISHISPSGTGSVITRLNGLSRIKAEEDVDEVTDLCKPSLLKFTDASNGQPIAVSKYFIDKILVNRQGKAVVVTKNIRNVYISFEDADDLNADIVACYGTGGGAGGGGIYGGSGEIPNSTVATMVGDFSISTPDGPIFEYGALNETLEISGNVNFSNATVTGLPDSRPYKVYTALINQSGTSAPTVIVLENTIGNIVWSRAFAGVYYATLSGAFQENKSYSPNHQTRCLNESGVAFDVRASRFSNDVFAILTIDPDTELGVDAVLFLYPIEIRVYN